MERWLVHVLIYMVAWGDWESFDFSYFQHQLGFSQEHLRTLELFRYVARFFHKLQISGQKKMGWSGLTVILSKYLVGGLEDVLLFHTHDGSVC